MTEPGCGFLAPPEVDALLEHRLPAARRGAFETHLASGCAVCALLAADARVFADIASGGLRAAEAADFESRRPLLEKRLAAAARAAAPPRARLPGRRLVSAALAVAATITIALIVVPRLGSGPGGGVALPGGGAVAIDPMAYTPPPSVRAGGPAEAWSAAGAAYTTHDWNAAAQRFGPLAATEDAPPDAGLYQGIALLMARRPAEARAALDRARDRAAADALPTGAIDWYRALAALALDNAAEARAALDAAASSGGAYAPRAAELRARLGP